MQSSDADLDCDSPKLIYATDATEATLTGIKSNIVSFKLEDGCLFYFLFLFFLVLGGCTFCKFTYLKAWEMMLYLMDEV